MSKDNKALIDEVEALVITCFKALVDREDDVKVTTIAGRHNVIFEVDVHEEDVQFALGKNHVNVDAVRVIVRAKCKKSHLKFELDVLEKRGRSARGRAQSR